MEIKKCPKKVSSDQFRVTVHQTVAAPSQIIIPSTIQVSGWVLHNCSPDLQGLIYVSAFWHFSDILSTFMSFPPPPLILFGESREHPATFLCCLHYKYDCAHIEQTNLPMSTNKLTLNLDLENENPTDECNYQITTNHALTPPLCVIHACCVPWPTEATSKVSPSPFALFTMAVCLAGPARGRITERRFHQR